MTPQQQSEQPISVDIQREAEELYPLEDVGDFTKNKQMDNAFMVVMQEAYIAGRTKSLAELEEARKEMANIKAEVLRRVLIIKSEPDGQVRETMINELPNNL